MKFVKVDKNQNVFTVTLEKEVTLESLHNQLNNRRKKSDFKLLHTFEFDDECVEVYGYKTGVERNINKLELPSPIDSELFYDDLVFCSKDSSNYVDFERDDFQDFYDSIFDSFDDLEDYEEEDEFEQDEDYISDDGFVVKD